MSDIYPHAIEPGPAEGFIPDSTPFKVKTAKNHTLMGEWPNHIKELAIDLVLDDGTKVRIDFGDDPFSQFMNAHILNLFKLKTTP